MLAALTALVAWNRLRVDPWMARVDVLTFFLPWYGFMGDQLRDLNVPGWNPHLFSGMPFAADPESGWMYLPAMLFFPFLSATAAFKAMVVFQLAVAGLSTYAFVRVLGMGVVAALVGATVFEFGPLLYHDTYCCTIRAQLAVWIPLALLGVELALRQTRWRDRVSPWFLAALAVTQMFSGWLGQGFLDGMLLVGGYLAYRALISPPRPGAGLRDRLVAAITTGVATLGLALAVGAAGILPRLSLNWETNLAGGSYDALGRRGHSYPPYRLASLVGHLLGDGPEHRAVAVGGTAAVLTLLAPLIARRRFGVPYFAVMTVVVCVLTLKTTPLHRLFFLIPRFEVLHEHAPHQVLAVVMIGPAVLSAATVESLPRWRGRSRLLTLAYLPLIGMLVALLAFRQGVARIPWMPILAATLVTALVCLVLVLPTPASRAVRSDRVLRIVPVAVLVVAFLQPVGAEIAQSELGRLPDGSWHVLRTPNPSLDEAVAANVSRTDPGGAGAFLRARLAESGPFRYFGYSWVRDPKTGRTRSTYQSRRLDPRVQAALLNARALRLGLYDVQGYKAVQPKRYVEFLEAINGEIQEYHVANVRPGGVASPLLDLLDVRYVVVDARLPKTRKDIVALTAGRREVFRTDRVVVYETLHPLPHAWIVHDVRTVERGGALPLLKAGTVDPRVTALVEGAAPPVSEAIDSSTESAAVTRYEPDEITIATRASAAGFLVVSEMYASGWNAYVDGRRVGILATDHVLRGLAVPAGAHSVQLRYEPVSLRVGLAITGVASAIMVAAFTASGFGWARRRKRRRGTTLPDQRRSEDGTASSAPLAARQPR